MRDKYKGFIDFKNLRLYLNQISKFPTLSQEDEKRLGNRIQKGDKKALKELIEANLRFVVSYVKKYKGMGIGMFDLINEGNLGLIEAAKRFDPSRNVKFISYAVWWIRQAIIHALTRYSRAYHLPQKLSDKISDMKRKVAELKTELGREPTREEIAKRMGIPKDEVEDLEILDGKNVSLSDKYFEEGVEMEDRIKDDLTPSVEYQIIKNSIQQQIREMLGELDDKEANVIRLRFGLDDDKNRTLQEIGDMLNLSRERIRQIEQKAMRKLARSRRLQQLRGYLN
ncbi:MAG: sigma-70 family RNA polymerase sigma factor [Candidatus Aminicenantes bacterium]|nr:sigma-70 family RNA polymerase sigma factor [Candidatus Aminicenantes bacterium]